MNYYTLRSYAPNVYRVVSLLMDAGVPLKHIHKNIDSHLGHKAYLRNNIKVRIQYIHPRTFAMSQVYVIHFRYENNKNWYEDLLADLGASELYAIEPSRSISIKGMSREALSRIAIVYCVSDKQSKPKPHHERNTTKYLKTFFDTCVTSASESMLEFLKEFPEHAKTAEEMQYWAKCNLVYAKITNTELLKQTYSVASVDEFLTKYVHQGVTSDRWRELIYQRIFVPLFAVVCVAKQRLAEYEQSQIERGVRLGVHSIGLSKDQYGKFWTSNIAHIALQITSKLAENIILDHILGRATYDPRVWCQTVAGDFFQSSSLGVVNYGNGSKYVSAFDCKAVPVPYARILQKNIIPPKDVLVTAMHTPVPILLYASATVGTGKVIVNKIRYKDKDHIISANAVSVGFRGDALVYRFLLNDGHVVTIDPIAMSTTVGDTKSKSAPTVTRGIAREEILKDTVGVIRILTIKI